MIARIVHRLLSLTSVFLVPLEHALTRPYRHASALQYPPVFIIGAPRTGTTLLYKALVERYRFVHFTNLTAPFFRTPAVATWLATQLLPAKPTPADYTFRFGETAGWHGPHEAGEFWYRWFPRGDQVYVPPGATSEVALSTLRCEVIGMAALGKAPALFKNTYNSMRIAPIVEALPEASFLVARRDPQATARSLLRGRIAVHGSKETWWSLPPREVDEIKRHRYWEQVVEQVYYTYQQIESDRFRFGEERFHAVQYEDLCRDALGTLGNIEAFLAARGVRLESRNEVPLSFQRSSSDDGISTDDARRITEKVRELWG